MSMVSCRDRKQTYAPVLAAKSIADGAITRDDVASAHVCYNIAEGPAELGQLWL